MKPLAICVTLFWVSFSQPPAIPVGAAEIQLTAALPDSVLFAHTRHFLTAQRWVIASSDARQRTLVTAYRNFHYQKERGEWWRIRLLIRVQANTICFRSEWSAPFMETVIEGDPVLFVGAEDAIYKRAFRRMDGVARQLAKQVPIGEIRYQTR